MKKQTMKRIAASIAALCICSMAVAPVAVSAATIVIKDSATNNVSMANKNFAAYKIFDVEKKDESSYVYTIADEWKPFLITQLKLTADSATLDYDAAQAILAEGFDVNAFANAAYDYAKANTSTIKATSTVSATADNYNPNLSGNEVVTFPPSLANGYYLVADTSTNGGALSAVMLDQIDDDTNAEITLKADQPTIVKKIDEGGTLVDANTACIGENVEYNITSAVPNMEHYKEYVFKITDTFCNGLDFNNDVKVKIGDDTLTTDEYTITASPDTGHVETVVIDFGDLKTIDGVTTGEAITVTYSAKVNASATIGEDGNLNKVKLTYSSNPNKSGDGNPDTTPDNPDNPNTPDNPDDDNETTDTPDDEVITYLTKFQINKVDQNGGSLTGAKFKIEGPDGFTTMEDVEVNKDGQILVNGICAGTYTITETKAPAGYNPITAPITLTVGCKVDEGDISNANTTVEYTPGSNKKCTWSYNGTGENDSTGLYVIEVENKAGGLFPTTGGMGTTIFTVLGVSLMAGAAGVFVIKRKAMNK